jgi:hypothetical protein
MTLLVYLKNTETGEEHLNKMDLDWHEASDFLWSEGNFACDCNRGNFFAEAAGEEDPPDHKCGSELYEVWITDKDGNILYDER